MTGNSRHLSLAVAIAIAIGTSVHSTPASSQAAVVVRALSARSTSVAMPRVPPRLEYGSGLRSIHQLETTYNRTLPRALVPPSGNFKAENDNGAVQPDWSHYIGSMQSMHQLEAIYNGTLPTASWSPISNDKAANDNLVREITEADIKEICEPTSGGATSAAYDRLTSALKANSYRRWRPEERKDIAQEVLARILEVCEKIMAGHYPSVPGAVHKTLRRHMIDLVRADRKLEPWIVSAMLAESSRSNANPIGAIEARSALEKLSPRLTDRERQVLIGIASGLDTKEIAKQISIAENVSITADRVREIREQIRRKLRQLD